MHGQPQRPSPPMLKQKKIKRTDVTFIYYLHMSRSNVTLVTLRGSAQGVWKNCRNHPKNLQTPRAITQTEEFQNSSEKKKGTNCYETLCRNT